MERKLEPEQVLSKAEVESSESQIKSKAVPAEASRGGLERKNAASIANRIGLLSAILFFGSSLFAIACMGWFAFLWWGSVDNSVWHDIVINNWAVRAISLPSSLFRMAVAIQAGACLSMLAALAIEKAYVPLPNVAAISIMRATAPSLTETLLKFALPLLHASGIRDIGTLSVVLLAIFILLTSSILGFSSTILLSDVVVQPIPSKSTNITVPLDYVWHNNSRLLAPDAFYYNITTANSYWQSSRPFVLPAFAEWSTGSPSTTPGIVDTGRTIRAFLPFPNSNDRSRLRDYQGSAVVLDSRVVCQKPKISNFKFYQDSNGFGYAVSGDVRKSVPFDAIQNAQPDSTFFFCGINRFGDLEDRPIICQLSNAYIGNDQDQLNLPVDYAGGLKSEFGTPARRPQTGGAYLVLNQTNPYTAGPYLQDHPEWAVIGNVSASLTDTVIGTLCYTSLDAVDRTVEISGRHARSEPEFGVYFNNPNTFRGEYNFTNIFPQLVSSSIPESRGLLSLNEPQSGWIQPVDNSTGSDGPWGLQTRLIAPLQQHFLTNALSLRLQKPNTDTTQIYGNYTAILDDLFISEQVNYEAGDYTMAGRTWMGDLWLAIKEHPDGNSAKALQAVLTMIASNAYYDNFSLFDKFGNVTTVVFQNASSPGGPFGTRRGSGSPFQDEQLGLLSTYVKGRFPVGYTIVAVMLGLQIILAMVIIARFMRETKLTRIGDPWQALAQVASTDDDIRSISAILEASRRVGADRATVAGEFEARGESDTRVGMEQQGESSILRRRRGGGGDV
ncbi:hypothetical protein TWF694_011649 [Orbilia ellipsospora]|uniref:Uncharacterized protein n=1 Tax=Orbilia ellipsospora TaxID=2528407 RepID=A0AAV9X8H1_9PEZI